jgi:hypothetical protein
VGWILLPRDLLGRITAGQVLSEADEKLMAVHPAVARQLLERIPRLELIARMIEDQRKPLSHLAVEGGSPAEATVAMGAHLLKTALDYDELIQGGLSHGQALAALQALPAAYRPEVLKALAQLEPADASTTIDRVRLDDLREGMVVTDGILDSEGNLLVARGTELTYPIIIQVFNLAQRSGFIRQPIQVYVPSGV